LLRADLGPSYSDDAIEAQLKLYKLSYRKVDDIVSETVKLLLDGKIVGWFQGRMEFGARALGNRSIVANPTLSTMKDKINKYVKFREEFRPFAPSVVEEAAGTYFKVRDPIPFMTVVVDVTPEGARRLPATTHVDGTARVQTVNREEMPLYWKLISAFGEATGTPVVLNTSFNVMGEPIVENPDQAIRCFFSCGMDALAIGNFVLEKDREGD
jgi:carbamoyltransferase